MEFLVSSTKSNAALLLCAIIWGFAFVAQRVGMEYIGPFTYNGVRFALGAVSLLPLIFFLDRKNKKQPGIPAGWIKALRPGLIAGMVLFAGSSLQQVGLISTEAGKAAFITGLYMVLVPFGLLLFKKPLKRTSILASLIATAGLYFISVKSDFSISRGDLFELAGSFFWAAHILVIDSFVKKTDVLKLAFFQCITCSLLSSITALITEPVAAGGIEQALVPILYGGLCSVGIAYTLQIIGQKHAHPSHSAIILSMETVFAAIGGYFILDERLGLRAYAGCILMFAGMMLSQYSNAAKSEVGEMA